MYHFAVSNHILHAITDIGDSGVLSLAMLIGSIVLLLHGNRVAALRFAATFVVTAIAIGCSKILFIGCGNALSHAWNLRSPSGHSGLSTAFFGAIAATIQPSFHRIRRTLLWIGTGVGILLIAWSRVMLGYHTLSEVLFGLTVGVGVCWWIYRIPLPANSQTTPNKQTLIFFGLTLIIALSALHGRHFPAEQLLAKLAFHLHSKVAVCANSS